MMSPRDKEMLDSANERLDVMLENLPAMAADVRTMIVLESLGKHCTSAPPTVNEMALVSLATMAIVRLKELTEARSN